MSHVERSPAVEVCLAQQLFGSMDTYTQEKIAGILDLDLVGPLDALGLLQSQVDYLLAAMIDWMGPGGDVAFLEFVLLADQKMPISITFLPMIVKEDELSGEFPRNFFYNYSASGGDWPRAFRRNPGDPAINESMIDRARQILGDRFDEFLHQVFLPPVRMQIYRDYDFFSFLVEPLPGYRTIVMGELAQPWEPVTRFPTCFYRPTGYEANPPR
jgi:hypothetical protein